MQGPPPFGGPPRAGPFAQGGPPVAQPAGGTPGGYLRPDKVATPATNNISRAPPSAQPAANVAAVGYRPPITHTAPGTQALPSGPGLARPGGPLPSYAAPSVAHAPPTAAGVTSAPPTRPGMAAPMTGGPPLSSQPPQASGLGGPAAQPPAVSPTAPAGSGTPGAAGGGRFFAAGKFKHTPAMPARPATAVHSSAQQPSITQPPPMGSATGAPPSAGAPGTAGVPAGAPPTGGAAPAGPQFGVPFRAPPGATPLSDPAALGGKPPAKVAPRSPLGPPAVPGPRARAASSGAGPSAPQPAARSSAPRIDPAAVPRPRFAPPDDPLEYQSYGADGSSTGQIPAAYQHYVAKDTGAATPRHLRMSLHRVPLDRALLNDAELPMVLNVAPLAPVRVECGELAIPAVDFGEDGPVRCTRCRAYVNPYVRWTPGGNSWTCNLCDMSNVVPDWYAGPVDAYGYRRDRGNRPELHRGSIDFMVPASYLPRAAHTAPVWVFALEVTAQAVASGALATSLAAVRAALHELPDATARVGLIAFDDSLHFFNCHPARSDIVHLQVGDVEDPFMPLSLDAWAPDIRQEAGLEKIAAALHKIEHMFVDTRVVQSAGAAAVGAALHGLHSFSAPGIISLYASSTPAVGAGKVTPRERVAAYGTDSEPAMWSPPAKSGATVYDRWAQLAVEAGVGLHMYALNGNGAETGYWRTLLTQSTGKLHVYREFAPSAATAAHLHVASPAAVSSGPPPSRSSLGGPPTSTGPPGPRNTPSGAHHHTGPPTTASSVPGRSPRAGSSSLAPPPSPEACAAVVNDTRAALHQEYGFGSVLKVRTSKGVKVRSYSIGAPGSMEAEAPALSASSGVYVQLVHDGNELLENGPVYIQAAYLYISIAGDVRVRVHNLECRATDDVASLFKHADADVILQWWITQTALQAATQSKLIDRKPLIDHVVGALTAYRRHCATHSPPGQLILPESLKLSPLVLSAAMKHALLACNSKDRASAGNSGASGRAVYQGVAVRADERVTALVSAVQACPATFMSDMYARLYSLAGADPDEGYALEPLAANLLPNLEDGMNRVGSGVPSNAAPLILMPASTWPSAAQLSLDAPCVLDGPHGVWLYIGERVPAEVCEDLLGVSVPNANALAADPQLPVACTDATPTRTRVWNMIHEIRRWRPAYAPLRVIVPADTLGRAEFAADLVEDKVLLAPSYVDLLCDIHVAIQDKLRS